MDPKLALTKEILIDSGMPTDDAALHQYLNVWWKNPRLAGNKSFGLTSDGFEAFKKSNKFTFVLVDISATNVLTSKLICLMNDYITCPYYHVGKQLHVAKDYLAVQMIMFGGNLHSFFDAKTKTM